VRLSIATTDARTGELVVFDTAAGERITADHLLASCGFFPDFPPTEIAGRMLADGGFAANAPVEAVLGGDDGADLTCFVVDLFSPKGERPRSLEQAASRQWELLFGNQSRQKLESMRREHELHRALGQLAARLGPDAQLDEATRALLAESVPQSVHVYHLAYCPRGYEAGPEMAYDFSPSTLGDRWQAGVRDMDKAIALATEDAARQPGFHIHRVPPQSAPAPSRKAA
jgi:NTE family protein